MTSVPARRVSTDSRFSRWANRHRKWVFASPAMLFIAAMIVVPLGYTIFLSFTDAAGSVRASFDFVGLLNYIDVLADTERFWPAVGRTLIFTVAALVVEFAAGMGIALLLRRSFRGQKWVRIAILLPLVATPVAVGMMWLLIFEPNIGFANQLLSWIGLPAQGWISDPSTALGTLIFVDAWQWTPMMVLILLAGLTSLPEEPDEAAQVDGASAVQRFFYVTLPMLRSTVIAALLLRGIDAVKTFDILYATKGAGGGSFHEVETLNVYAYGLTFNYNEYGTASAVLMLFLLLIVVAIAAITLLRKKGSA